MRFIAIILAVFVVALSVLPCCVCRDDVDTPVAQEGSKQIDDCSLCCSPFQACGSCAGFTLPVTVDIAATVQIIPFQPCDRYQLNLISFHMATIWQPPKIA